MNKLLVGSLALAAMGFGGSAVRAADMPLKALPPPPVVYNWTGCYIGLDAGESYGRTSGYSNTGSTTLGGVLPLPSGLNETDPFNLSGFIGGVYGGCNYQTGAFVIGVEGDWSFTNKEGQAFANRGNQIAGQGGIGNSNDVWYLQERQVGTARLRLGYTVTPNWLWYITGGGAWTKINTSESIITNPIPRESAYQTHWRGGWTVGAGTEYMVGYGWSIRSEYLYVDLGRWTTFTNIPNGAQGTDTFTNLSVNLHDHIFRVGMAYKFGWTPAVVAKY
jgi:outer membrane immunogenic protein